MGKSDAKEAYRLVAERIVSPERFGMMVDAMSELVLCSEAKDQDRIAAFKAVSQSLKDIVLQRPDYVVEIDTRRRNEITLDLDEIDEENEEQMLALIAKLQAVNGESDTVNADFGALGD